MPPQFLGNPLDCDEFWDNDLELNVDEEWITLPHDTVLMEVRNPNNLTIDVTQSDDDTVWLEEDDDTDYNYDEDYNPNDEDYNPDDDYDLDEDYNIEDDVFEETQDLDDLDEMLNESVGSNIYDFYSNYGVDEDDYDDFDDDDDYVTYEDVTSPNPSTQNADGSPTKSASELLFDKLPTDTDTD